MDGISPHGCPEARLIPAAEKAASARTITAAPLRRVEGRGGDGGQLAGAAATGANQPWRPAKEPASTGSHRDVETFPPIRDEVMWREHRTHRLAGARQRATHVDVGAALALPRAHDVEGAVVVAPSSQRGLQAILQPGGKHRDDRPHQEDTARHHDDGNAQAQQPAHTEQSEQEQEEADGGLLAIRHLDHVAPGEDLGKADSDVIRRGDQDRPRRDEQYRREQDEQARSDIGWPAPSASECHVLPPLPCNNTGTRHRPRDKSMFQRPR